MSGRCKACDCFLEEWEMREIDPLTGTYTELCTYCLNASDDDSDGSEIDLELLTTQDVL